MTTKTFTLWLSLVWLLPWAHAARASDDLLAVDQAFQLSTRTVNDTTLEARWKIAPGYYLYRDKFKFEAMNGVLLKNPVFPRGTKKSDPAFGVTEIYLKSVKVRLPFARQASAPTARLRITAQGCNEPVGVCYPPMVKQVDFKLPPVTTPATSVTTAAQSLAGLVQAAIPASDEPQPVDPEQAFVVSLTPQAADTLLAHFSIADCCYLYRDKIKFALTAADNGAPPAGTGLGNYNLPPGIIKTDTFTGQTEVYEQGFDVALPISGLAAANSDLLLQVTYQGCAEKGVTICYPPMTKKFGVVWRGGTLSVVSATNLGRAAPVIQVPHDSRTLIIALLTAFGAGLLLSFTPCVLPMVPILSSMIVGQGDTHLSKIRGGLLSYSYVLGTAVTYAAAGVLAGLSGEQLQAYFQNPWAIGTFSALLVLLALSLFGFYDLQMPGFIQSHLHHRTRRLNGGSFIGVFILGLVSALIVGACVSPILISVLSVAIASKDPVLGGAIMFSLAHGQGAILIALGVGTSFLLPKVGKWMHSIKHLFGALLIAVAIYLLGYLPQVPVLLLWAALLIVSAVYLGATQSLPESAHGWRYLWKGIGTVFLIWGVLALLGGFAGNRDVLNPLQSFSLSPGALPVTDHVGPAAVAGSGFERVSTLSDLESRLAAAKAAGKPAILDFYASWCTDCRRLEQTTFADPRVRQALHAGLVLLQADVTDPNDPEVNTIKSHFGVYGPPAMLFFAANGEERRELRTYGYRNADDFLALLHTP
ncbi:MAG: protein-disulfide reductase DsbD [Sulfuricaulis sp.]